MDGGLNSGKSSIVKARQTYYLFDLLLLWKFCRLVLKHGDGNGDRGRSCRHCIWILGHNKVEEMKVECKFMEAKCRGEESDFEIMAGNESQ